MADLLTEATGADWAAVPAVGEGAEYRTEFRGLTGSALVLVRPDQHIACLGDCVSPATAPVILTRALTGFTPPG